MHYKIVVAAQVFVKELVRESTTTTPISAAKRRCCVPV